MPEAIRPRPGGISFGVRVTPRASRNALEGTWTGADGRTYIKARVTAAPHEGAANEATVALIAKALGVRQGNVRIVKGAAGREKTVEVFGDAAELSARLGALAKRERPG